MRNSVVTLSHRVNQLDWILMAWFRREGGDVVGVRSVIMARLLFQDSEGHR